MSSSRRSGRATRRSILSRTATPLSRRSRPATRGSSRPSGRLAWLTQWTEPFTQALANAQREQAGHKLFGQPEVAAQPTTQPATPFQYRQVTVIRNTKEQAVQLEVEREHTQQNIAKPDVDPAIPGGN